jgi:hypothetical protein
MFAVCQRLLPPPQSEAVLEVLAHLPAGLTSLAVDVLHDGHGLGQLALSADRLAGSLQTLNLFLSHEHSKPIEGKLEFLGSLTRLRSLRLISGSLEAAISGSLEAAIVPPAGLSRITALIALEAPGLELPLGALSALAPLVQLRELSFFCFASDGGGDGPPPPPLPGVTRLSCRVRGGLAIIITLAAAFPGVDTARLVFDRFGDLDLDLAPPPAAPLWPTLRRLLLKGFLPTNRHHVIFRSLGGYPPVLRALTLDLDGGFVSNLVFGNADFLELMHTCPLLERLKVRTYAEAGVTDAAFEQCPARPCLRWLHLHKEEPPKWLTHVPPGITLAGLLALGTAFPNLECLRLVNYEHHEEEEEGAFWMFGFNGQWAAKLDALPAGEPAAHRPDILSRLHNEKKHPKYEDRKYLRHAIYRALARGAVAPAPAPVPAPFAE